LQDIFGCNLYYKRIKPKIHKTNRVLNPYIIVLISNNMYTNSKIISIVSKSFSFVFLLLILVISSSIILAPSVNSNVYGQAGNGENENNAAAAAAQVGDQIQPLGNNLQNAKTISPDSRLTLSQSQDSKIEKNANNNPQLPDLTVNPQSKIEKNANNNPQLPDLTVKTSGPAYLKVITVYVLGIDNYNNAHKVIYGDPATINICLKYRHEVDTQSHLFATTDAAPPCAKGSPSGFTYTVMAPSTTKIDVAKGYYTVKNDCNNLSIRIGESLDCYVVIHAYTL
jgi:hypothetical protein